VGGWKGKGNGYETRILPGVSREQRDARSSAVLCLPAVSRSSSRPAAFLKARVPSAPLRGNVLDAVTRGKRIIACLPLFSASTRGSSDRDRASVKDVYLNFNVN